MTKYIFYAIKLNKLLCILFYIYIENWVVKEMRLELLNFMGYLNIDKFVLLLNTFNIGT